MKLLHNILSIWLLNALPDEYENFCVAIKSRERMPNLEELKTKFLEEEATRSHHERNDESNKEEALLFKTKVSQRWEKSEQKNSHTEQSKKHDYKCYTCSKIGHISKYCKSKRKQHNNSQSKENAM